MLFLPTPLVAGVFTRKAAAPILSMSCGRVVLITVAGVVGERRRRRRDEQRTAEEYRTKDAFHRRIPFHMMVPKRRTSLRNAPGPTLRECSQEVLSTLPDMRLLQ
jgi:hypothetical protein